MKKTLLATFVALVAAAGLLSAARDLTVQGIDYASTLSETSSRRLAPEQLSLKAQALDNPQSEFTFDDITNWTGTGSNRAALVIQWNDDNEENAIAFGYRWDGEATGIDMFRAVVAANPRLYGLIQLTNLGYTIDGIGWDADEDGEIALIDTGHDNKQYESEDGVFIHPSTAYDYDNWLAADADDYWYAGWYKGYWSYWVKDSQNESFSYSGLGASSRKLTDGSWDGWNASVNMGSYAWKEFVAAPVPGPKVRFTESGVHYTVLSAKNMTVSVSAPVEGESLYNGAVTVPASVAHDGVTYTVTGIDAAAFKGSQTTSVEINAGGKLSVGKQAFADCAALTSVKFTAGACAYRLADEVFSGSAALTTVSLPADATIERIGNGTFKGCTSVTGGSIPSQILSLTAIPASTYEGSGLTSSDINAAIEIGGRAFADCASLTAVTLGEQLLGISAEAFAGCDALTTVVVKAMNPLTINENTFSESAYANATLSVPYSAEANYRANAVWAKFGKISERPAEIVDGAIVSDGEFNYKICIEDGEVYLAVSPKGYTGSPVVPESARIGDTDYPVKAIDDYAFHKCSLDAAPVLPATIERIGRRAFSAITFPRNTAVVFTLPAAVKELGNAVFADYSWQVSNITINAVESPERHIFTELPDSLFTRAAIKSTNLLTPAVKKIGNYTFSGSSLEADLSEYNSLEEIGDYGFGGCKVTFRQSPALRRIGESAFTSGYTSYAVYVDDKLVMRKDVEYGKGAFNGLKGYTVLEIEPGVKAIPEDMFNNSAVVTIEGNIPEGVVSIGANAFKGTSKLTGPLSLPSSLETLGNGAFASSNLSEGIIIPEDSKITNIFAFNSSSIPAIHIPDGVTSLPSNCFNYCRQLKVVTGGKNLTEIGQNAFSSCQALESFTIPAGVTEIGEQAFYNCKALKTVDIPEGVVTVKGSYRGCDGIENIIVPATLKDLNKTSNGWMPFYSSNTTTKTSVWLCTTAESPLTAASAEMLCKDEDYYTKEKVPFSNYYVLYGAKEHLSSLYAREYTEVPVELTAIASSFTCKGNSAEVKAIPAYVSILPAAAAEEEEAVAIPEHFAAANAAYFHRQLGFTAEFKAVEEGGVVGDAAVSDIATVTGEDGKPAVTFSIVNLPAEGLYYRVVATDKAGRQYAGEWQLIDAATIDAGYEVPVDFDRIRFWVGEGDSKAAVVLQFNDKKGPENLVFGYRWASGENKTVKDALDEIAKADSRMTLLDNGVVNYESNDDGKLNYNDHNATTGDWNGYLFDKPAQRFVLAGNLAEQPVAANSVVVYANSTQESVVLPYTLMRPALDDTAIIYLPETIGYPISDNECAIPAFIQKTADIVNSMSTSQWSVDGDVPEIKGISGNQTYGRVNFADNRPQPCSASVTLKIRMQRDGQEYEYIQSNACQLTVSAPERPITAMEFTSSEIDCGLNKTVDNPLLFTPENPSYVKITYTSSDPTVAAVQYDGSIKTTATAGTAVITATYDYDAEVTASFTVTSSLKVPVTGIRVDIEGDRIVIPYRGTYSPKIIVEPADADITDYEIVYDDPTIVTDFGRGKYANFVLVAHKEGTTTMHLKALDGSGVTKDYTIEVEQPETAAIDFSDGTFILNEEWFGHTNGSVNYMDAKGEMHYRAVGSRNGGVAFGATSCYGMIWAGKLFVTSKQQADGGDPMTGGGRLVIADASDMKVLKRFDTLPGGGDGRASVGVSDTKVYIGSTGGVMPLDLNTLELGDVIAGTPGASSYSGQIGDMVYADGHVYAVKQSTGILVIDTEKDELVKTIEDKNIQGITRSMDGNVWAASKNSLTCIDPATTEVTETVALPDGQSISCDWGSWRPTQFFASAKENRLFWGFTSWEIGTDISTAADNVYVKSVKELPGENNGMRYGTSRVDDRTGEVLVMTTKSYGMDAVYNTYHWIDYKTGEVVRTFVPYDYFWFQAMPIFPDKFEPEISLEDVKISPYAEPEEIDLSEMVSDADANCLQAAIEYAVSGEATDDSNAIATVALKGRRLTVTPKNFGTTTFTLSAVSNGRKVTRQIDVKVDDGSGIGDLSAGKRSVSAAGGLVTVKGCAGYSFEIFSLTGQAVSGFDCESDFEQLRPTLSEGVYIIRGTDGTNSITAKIKL